jgi:hypothetical protein
MAKIEVWVSTGMVGSKTTRTVDVDDEDIIGLDDRARDEVLGDYAEPVRDEMIEWGWTVIEGPAEPKPKKARKAK